jgi:hypothetical protein
MNLAAFILAWIAGVWSLINGAWATAMVAAAIILILWTTVIH